jgi:hypothetical protein
MATNLAGTPSMTPTETLTPTLTLTPSDTPTPIPTNTPTPSPSAPFAQIRIQSPGPMSKVTSPMTLRVQVVSVRAAAEVGLITISTKDDFGRLQAQLGMRVLLLSLGAEEITPEGDSSERVVFYSPPREDAVVQGGILNVEGRMLPFNDQPVILELIDPAGKTVGLRLLDFTGVDEQLFSTTLPYKVSEPTQARLILRQDDDRLDGYIYLYSQEITLNP